MALHPIRALDHVLDEYRDYLRTEFRAKDPALRNALERELEAPGFLAQEPFYQAHRPFKTGAHWRDLPIDARLAGVLEDRSKSPSAYLHQSEAIRELLSPTPRSVVVTTGTGSGKSEAFLLPVIQNAFEDSVRFKKAGLTAILIYPMNALANDQKLRIDEYLAGAGMEGAVRVEQYDRSTTQAKRQEMRANPPHILLTNYMMLEYLLVRPADREGIFANHRCRFLVLDEVHTYRGILGSNIALLTRRLKVHLERATQNWGTSVGDQERSHRFPQLVPVGTSATIKSVNEEGLTREQVISIRDQSVQEFFGTLTGVEKSSIRVFGEELQDIAIPAEATYPAAPVVLDTELLNLSDVEEVRKALCQLAGSASSANVETAAQCCRLLWDLNHWLIRRPMSVSQIVQQLRDEVPARANQEPAQVQKEVEAALVIGAALPDGTPGALRLRAHRFLRGGWKFHRCVNPDCGKLHPMGEEKCGACNHLTAPLYLCRNCGADYLRMVGDVATEPLRPSADPEEGPECLVYEPERFDRAIIIDDDDDDADGQPTAQATRGRRNRAAVPAQIRNRPILNGSLDPATLQFSSNSADYRLQVSLAPARLRCLGCGGTAGSRNVITPVALGTSAAVKVIGEGLVETLAEANHDRPGHDGKERLLIFSDSRQDAAHQARFIIFASRYDRMRSRLLSNLQNEKALSIQRAVELLSDDAVSHRDNPFVPDGWIHDEARDRIHVWEEAPLLDEISLTAGYRGTIFNLGLAGITYNRLDEYVRQCGTLIAQALGIKPDEVEYVCRIVLDHLRARGALSRPMLRYHPLHTSCPRHFQAAEWERRVKQPKGLALGPNDQIVTHLDKATIPFGVTHENAWRKQGVGGRSPGLERILKELTSRFGGVQPDANLMESLLKFLKDGNFVIASELLGARDRIRLLQVNSEVIRIVLLNEQTRLHCNVCGDVRPCARSGAPCSRCHGELIRWPDADIDNNRTVKRIRSTDAIPLVAHEHTAQVTTQDRAKIESDFKADAKTSPVNVLACSPTLEMGIDVGGLDAVVMRNVPPRPDNYAQRGGRAGRRSRVGIVLGYARSTPHDQYFFDHPREMIAGEVPAPALSLYNRDVLVRHLYAIVFGSTEPGLAGRMIDYIDPQGAIKTDAVSALIAGVGQQTEHAIAVAQAAWGRDVLVGAQLDESQLRAILARLPERIQHVFDSTSRQVIELRQALEFFAQSLERRYAGNRAADLVARLLGIPTENRNQQGDSDDRSAGYPLRRFAEFGLLPGYEFPSEPASLRLLGDEHEEDPISVTRRFGIGQFQPDAHVYARKKRWKVIGLDTSSPWNPRTEGPTWSYRVCGTCTLRYNGDEPSCPRCRKSSPGQGLPAYDMAGFIAKADERPVLDEEDRFAVRNLVEVYAQWDGDVIGRWSFANGWALRLSRNEEVRWVNEGPPPTPAELQSGVLMLHPDGKGWLLCPSCGRMLDAPAVQPARGGRVNPAGIANTQNSNGHAESCPHRGALPRPLAIATSGKVEVLRLLVPVPRAKHPEDWHSWGFSLGYSLLQGMRRHFALDLNELDFELEGPWDTQHESQTLSKISLTFIDSSLGGSGYLPKIAEDFHQVAARAIQHLDHPNCETACYRCLKAYQNQRHHDQLCWPLAIESLEDLAASASQKRSLQLGDIDDPRPWLDAYAAGVGSPLELKFLHLFEQHGFHPQKQVPVSPSDIEPAISVADFAVPERRLAIYIDGASFHVGANLRRDRFIRNRLRQGSTAWRVEELRAGDLSRGAELARSLQEENC